MWGDGLILPVYESAQVDCCICLQAKVDPVTTHCGHSFCRQCLHDHWVTPRTSRTRCPLCRATLHMMQILHPMIPRSVPSTKQNKTTSHRSIPSTPRNGQSTNVCYCNLLQSSHLCRHCARSRLDRSRSPFGRRYFWDRIIGVK